MLRWAAVPFIYLNIELKSIQMGSLDVLFRYGSLEMGACVKMETDVFGALDLKSML